MPSPVKRRQDPERQLQYDVLQLLRLTGYVVLETNVGNQRINADKGVSDLLVSHSSWPKGCWLAIELKRPDKAIKWSSLEQEDLWRSGRTAMARSIDEAAYAVIVFEWDALKRTSDDQVPSLARLAERLPLERKREVFNFAS